MSKSDSLTRYGTVHNDEIPRSDGQFYLRGQVDLLIDALTAERDALKATGHTVMAAICDEGAEVVNRVTAKIIAARAQEGSSK